PPRPPAPGWPPPAGASSRAGRRAAARPSFRPAPTSARRARGTPPPGRGRPAAPAGPPRCRVGRAGSGGGPASSPGQEPPRGRPSPARPGAPARPPPGRRPRHPRVRGRPPARRPRSGPALRTAGRRHAGAGRRSIRRVRCREGRPAATARTRAPASRAAPCRAPPVGSGAARSPLLAVAEEEAVRRVVALVPVAIAQRVEELPEGAPAVARHLHADQDTARVVAVVAVVEQRDVPVRAHLLEEAHQRPGAFRKLEPEHPL